MEDLLLMLAHLLATLARLLGPGEVKAIVADSLLMKQQLLIINRSRRRAPNLIILLVTECCSASGRYFSIHTTFSEQRSFSGH
jgi:glutamyl-tRNA reductase